MFAREKNIRRMENKFPVMNNIALLRNWWFNCVKFVSKFEYQINSNSKQIGGFSNGVKYFNIYHSILAFSFYSLFHAPLRLRRVFILISVSYCFLKILIFTDTDVLCLKFQRKPKNIQSSISNVSLSVSCLFFILKMCAWSTNKMIKVTE